MLFIHAYVFCLICFDFEMFIFFCNYIPAEACIQIHQPMQPTLRFSGSQYHLDMHHNNMV